MYCAWTPLSPAERFRDRSRDKEHSVQIRAAFAQRFAGDEALPFGFVALLPFQIDVQIDSLASAVIGFAEKSQHLWESADHVPSASPW